MDQVTGDHGIEVLIPPDSSKRDAPRPGWTGGRYDWMRSVLAFLGRSKSPITSPRRVRRRGGSASSAVWAMSRLSINFEPLRIPT
jgi:hypothetical protein